MFIVSLHCLVLRLMGTDDEGQAFSSISGTITNEEDLLQKCISTGKDTLVQYIYLYRLILAYWLQDYEEAARLSEMYGRGYMRFLDIYHVFYEALAAFCLAQTQNIDRDKWIGIGEKAVSKFEVWKGYSSWNFENKHFLLSAELLCVKGDYAAAEERYNASILSAQMHRFVHEEGLALERLGMLYKDRGRAESAQEMLANARICYESWGASAVVARLDLNMSEYME